MSEWRYANGTKSQRWEDARPTKGMAAYWKSPEKHVGDLLKANYQPEVVMHRDGLGLLFTKVSPGYGGDWGLWVLAIEDD